jgi:beta-galactosidase/beta-glucuronidase
MRDHWADLTGTWSCRHDDEDAGLAAGWQAGFGGRDIRVPFPPESTASGIGETGFHPVVWYSRTIGRRELDAAGGSDRTLLHFGAVDYRASVWIDGAYVGGHEGGHTPFTFDVTRLVAGDGDHLLVVRAEDDPHDVTQPRGKQDWHEAPHRIWYHRTTGIWQTVWLETVPAVSVDHLRWTPAGPAAVHLSVRLRGSVPADCRVRVALWWEEGRQSLCTAEATASGATVELAVPVARQRNGQAADELWWSPERPRLIDATVTVLAGDAVLDAVSSYVGLRTVSVARGTFVLNNRPYDVRSVLSQGYWPDTHLAAPSDDAYRAEVELIKELGFNAARVHQKVEDPRFLYWADRLGLLLWGEAPSAYEFGPVAVRRLMREWMDVVDRDSSHPSIVTWVPANESWGIQHVATDPAQQAYARALADVTRALDQSRPVISNDGWEHQNSDIVSVHDYEGDGTVLGRTYADEDARRRLLTGMGPTGRRILVDGVPYRDQPIMLTEFGGVNYEPGTPRADSWGYTAAADEEDYLARITSLYEGIRASAFLAGSCYTQLTDTMQETNGLCTADRKPKVPVHLIRAAVTGRP